MPKYEDWEEMLLKDLEDTKKQTRWYWIRPLVLSVLFILFVIAIGLAIGLFLVGLP